MLNLLRQKNTNVQNAATKEETENFWKEMFGKKVQHNTGSKTSAKKIPIWKEAQYLKRRSQRY
jgi:hypothetical protein